VPTEGIALAFVCDISGSMAERDFAWETGNPPDSRLRAVQRAFRLFVEGGPAPDGVSLEGRPADAIALVSLAAWPRTECPLTLNHSVLLGMVDHLEAKTGGLDAGTNIGDAIAEGLIRLQAATELRRVVILLSDGEHNASREGPHAPLTPRQAAQLAANLGIPIYTIDCGGEPQADAPAELQQQRRDGRRVLDNIASMTQGRSFVANSGSELRQVYAAIDQLERRPIESAVYRRYHEYRGWCVAGAVASWLLLMVLEELLWRRWPQ
jgi:Ca-activated chloride channel family protein